MMPKIPKKLKKALSADQQMYHYFELLETELQKKYHANHIQVIKENHNKDSEVLQILGIYYDYSNNKLHIRVR